MREAGVCSCSTDAEAGLVGPQAAATVAATAAVGDAVAGPSPVAGGGAVLPVPELVVHHLSHRASEAAAVPGGGGLGLATVEGVGGRRGRGRGGGWWGWGWGRSGEGVGQRSGKGGGR